MKKLIDRLDVYYSENIRLVKTLMKRESPDEHPERMKWSLQTLYFDGKDWIHICRIDNYIHENQKGSHIHEYSKSKVIRFRLSFEEAEKVIKDRSRRIIREIFHENIEFGDERDEKRD